jgi:GT2 family glycosyltransferase
MISLLLVNFRAAMLAADAIRTARASSSAPIQVVVVDNSCDPREAEALRGAADTLIASPSNLGYAGAINAGRRVCEGEAIIVANPDVTFAAGAIDALVDALGDAAVAGPALFWDEEHRWMLPPGDRDTALEKLDAVFAGRSRAWFAERDRRRFRRRVAFWSLRRTAVVRMLSGAVMAIRAADFDDVDGFDERFHLYFEETDFLRRIAERRKRIVYVPSARCRHLYNQSASQIGSEAAARFAESERRYLEKWNGPLLARTLKRLERPLPSQDAQRIEGPIVVDRDDVVVEASPLASFTTAAGCFAREGEVDVPANAWTSPALYVRTVVRETGEILATYAKYRS